MSSIIKLGIAAWVTCACGTAFATIPNHVVSNYGTVGDPFTQGFSNSLSANPAPPESSPVGWGSTQSVSLDFYDDYVFTLSAASGGSLSAAAVTIDLGSFLGIDNFQGRIYSIASTSDLTNGLPSSGTATYAWSTPLNSPGLNGTALSFSSLVPLQANTMYAFEVRGLVTGTAGGSYGGNLNITPVPESAGWAMALAGLGLLVLTSRLQRR